MNNFLQIMNVSKRYANHIALDNVSININKGTIFGLLGPNGAGKTSLIRIINRITAPDEGEIILDGESIKNYSISRIGYLPEERGLYKKMKVGDHAIYLARLKGVSKSEAIKQLTFWFEKFDIMPWWNKKVEELSKGMQQKIQFVCTIIHNPDLLIFDEPFSGFDPINAEILKKEILELKSQGKTIIFSTHNMQSVEEICDDIALINKSQVVLNGKVSEIKKKYSQGIISLSIKSPFHIDHIDGADIISIQTINDAIILSIRKNRDISNISIIKSLPDDVDLISVEEETLSMNEIFINTIQKQHE